MKKAFAVFAVLAVVVLSGCGEKNLGGLVVHVDSSRDITIEKGRILIIELSSNPTTGYSWDWIKEKDERDRILKLYGKPTYLSESKLIGAGGTINYPFKALRKGEVNLIFEYKRSWEKDVSPAEKYTIKVVVE